MNIWQKIKGLFSDPVVETVMCKGCHQLVFPELYVKKDKHHRIGSVRNKKGQMLTIFCDGEEQ